MSLEMIMTKDRTHAKPGFSRSATVIFHAVDEKPVPVKAFFARIVGTSKTQIATQDHDSQQRHVSSSVFWQRQINNLGWGRNPLPDGYRMEVEFQFPFPDDGSPACRYQRVFEKAHMYKVSENCNLPPSGDFGQGNMIAYHMEFNLMVDDSDICMKAERSMTFSTVRTIVKADPTMITAIQSKPFCGQENSDDPRQIKLILKYASQVVQGESLLAWISLADEDEHSAVKVLVKSSFVQLIESTAVQGDGSLRDQWTNSHMLAYQDFRDDLPAITTQAVDLGALLQNPSISVDYPPSFSCTNIQRTYGMSVSLTVEIENGEIHEFRFDLDSIVLLPAEDIETAWEVEIKEGETGDECDTPTHRARFAGR